VATEADEFVLRARGGDREALALLLKRQGPAARRAIRGQIPTRWQSVLSEDDVMQQTFADAVAGIDQCRAEDAGSFIAWLGAVARNNLYTAIEALAAAKRGGRWHRVELMPVEDSQTALVRIIAARDDTPGRRVIRREAAEALVQSIEQLPSLYASVVRLYDLEGQSVQEVSKRLDRSPGAVFMLRARAHDRLARTMGNASDFLTSHS
jgi:RNA polymerase sigma factor (sigma-70 family)